MRRDPIDVDRLRAQCAASVPGLVTGVDVVSDTASTNADLVRAAAAGTPTGTVLVAEWQRAGRGRFDRQWISPRGAGLTFSVLLRPPASVPREFWGWLPLLAGSALCVAVRTLLPGADVALKWPNDLMVDGRKAAGILAEACGDAVVLGMGVNVDHTAAELPPGVVATSLALSQPDRPVDRGELLVAVLSSFAPRYARWCSDGNASGVRAEYTTLCATVGSDVEVTVPGETLAAYAVSVSESGALILKTPAGPRSITAGDVAHVRRRVG